MMFPAETPAPSAGPPNNGTRPTAPAWSDPHFQRRVTALLAKLRAAAAAGDAERVYRLVAGEHDVKVLRMALACAACWK
jgi:hypothetical protein